MTGRSVYKFTAVVLLALVSALPAQDAHASLRTQTVRGVVRDAAKQGVAGAEVVLWLKLGLPDAGKGIEDVVRVKCDERGRFRAKILPGYSYSASAHWRSGERAGAAHLLEDVRGGDVLRMEEDASFVAKRAIKFSVGRRMPVDDREIKLSVRVGKRNSIEVVCGIPVALGEETVFELPFAGRDGVVELELCVRQIPLYRERSAKKNILHTLEFHDTVALFVSTADEQPLAGASVDLHYRGQRDPWLAVGRVDRQGALQIPRTALLRDKLRLRVRAPGQESEIIWLSKSHVKFCGAASCPLPEEIHVRMRKGAREKVLVRGLDGEALPGALVGVRTTYRYKVAAASWNHERASDWAATDSQGRAYVSSPRSKAKRFFTIVLPPRVMREFRDRCAPNPCPPPILSSIEAVGESTSIDLSKLDLRTCSFVLPDESPARGARIYTSKPLTSVTGNFELDLDLDALPRCDRRGRFTWLEGARQKRSTRFAFVLGHGWAEFGGADAERQQGAIVFTPFACQRLSVLDFRGVPVSGAVVKSRGRRSTTWNDQIDFVWRLNAETLQGRTNDAGIFVASYVPDFGLHYELTVSARGQSIPTSMPEDPRAGWKVKLDPEWKSSRGKRKRK